METLDGTPLWELVHHYAYPPFEAQLATLRGATEDDVLRLVVWCIETIAGDTEHIDPFTRTFHDKVVASIRRADSEADTNATTTAAALVCTVAAICMEPLIGDDYRIEKAYRGLTRSLADNYGHADGVRHEILRHYTSALQSQLGEWVKQFVARDEYLTDESGRWNIDTTDDTDNEDAPQGNVLVRTHLLMSILKECGMGTDRQEATKVCRLASYIMGTSYKSMLNHWTKALNPKTHQKDIGKANELLSDFEGVKLRLKC